jgi:hypothetical protein
MNEQKKLKTNCEIIFGRKIIPKGKVLVVGSDINEKEFAALLAMGKEVQEITDQNNETVDALKDLQVAVNRIEELSGLNEILREDLKTAKGLNDNTQKELDETKELIDKLNSENESIIAENGELKVALEAAAPPALAGDQEDKKEKTKK